MNKGRLNKKNYAGKIAHYFLHMKKVNKTDRMQSPGCNVNACSSKNSDICKMQKKEMANNFNQNN